MSQFAKDTMTVVAAKLQKSEKEHDDYLDKMLELLSESSMGSTVPSRDSVRQRHLHQEAELALMERQVVTLAAHTAKMQAAIEKLEQVERCFVHVDYMGRPHDDHDRNVPLMHKTHPLSGRSDEP